MRNSTLILTTLCLLLLTACSTTNYRPNIEDSVPLDKSLTEIPEQQLLNVSIEIFDPGELPAYLAETDIYLLDITRAVGILIGCAEIAGP